MPPTEKLTQPDLGALFEPYRGELRLHCYRTLGSLHDAEDAVQETLFRAWRRFDTFQGSASLRTWLYAIATNACLDALKKRPPRTLFVASVPAADPNNPIPAPTDEALWLEPCPDSWLAEATADPEARYTRRESVSLAFLTALHLLPPRQRAILMLSDVLDWRASEIADLLELSVSAVNSALHRARVTLAKSYQREEAATAQAAHPDAATDALLRGYMQAWESDDVAGLVALLREDAILSMPPFPAWYQGREAVRAILLAGPFRSGPPRQWRLYPTWANGQPAFVFYRADASTGRFHAFGVQVVALDGPAPASQITQMTVFKHPSLVIYFGFPPHLSEEAN